jgi:tetratricopeptide (TPR) repeat protein
LCLSLARKTVAIRDAAFAPDGKRAVSASEDGTLRLWDLAGKKTLRTFTGHDGAVFCAAFTADGKRLFSGGVDRSLRLWDVESGRQQAEWYGHDAAISCLSIAPDGARVLTGSADGGALCWDVPTGRELCFLHVGTGVDFALFTPDGKRVVVGGKEPARLCDPETSEQWPPNLRPGDPLRGAALMPDGKVVLQGGVGKRLEARVLETQHQRAGAFGDLQPPLECPRLHLAAAVSIRELGEPERALRLLLPLAASHRGDTFYHSTITKCSLLLKDERLARHVLNLWRKAEPGYSGCLYRGRLLIPWAWEARGSGWANTVTPEGARQFELRLLEAWRELEKAVRINPSDWIAHAYLLDAAKGLGLPREFVEEHFQAAVKLRPRYPKAYQAKMEYLRPRWNGSPEEMLDFGRECLDTGYWDEHIPRLFPYALNDCCTVPRDSGMIHEMMRSPLVWDSILAYYRSAQKSADPGDRQAALNRLVQWGVDGEHYEDVVVGCQKLRRSDRINRLLFSDADDLEFLYDLVHAKTGKLMTQLSFPAKNDLALARTGAALAEGRIEQAAEQIERIEPGDHLDNAKVASYRAAIAVGRKLSQEKQIDLKGAEGLEAFLGARPLWKYGGDQFVCTLPPKTWTILTFPLGIKHGVITGVLGWTEGLAYAQIVAHTRAPRDPVILRYLPNRNVQLIRNDTRINEGVYPAGPLVFRLAYDGRMDQLQPNAGVTWQAGVYDDVPSGFSLRIYAADRPVTVTLRNLRIQLTD